MNIFKALSEGNGKISETNVTSFMSYLFDSSNELGNAFVLLFLELIDQSGKGSDLLALLQIDAISSRERVAHFSKYYEVLSEPELIIVSSIGKKQVPDILLTVSSKREGENVVYLIIENKIKKQSINVKQVEHQYNSFIQSDSYIQDKPVYSLLISPDDPSFEKMFVSGISVNKNTTWLKWTNSKNRDRSIEGILRRLIRLEQTAEIAPIDPHTIYIIKSFVDYISSEFSANTKGKRNFSFHGYEETHQLKIRLDDEIFVVKRYSNKMIRIYDVEDNPLHIPVRPLLRKIILDKDLTVDLDHSSGTVKNTQVLGLDVILACEALEVR